MHVTRCLTVITLLATSSVACVQPAAPVGYVVDSAGKPIANAVATRQDSGTQVQADEHGAFSLPEEGDDEVLIQASAEGFAPVVRRVHVGSLETQVWTLHKVDFSEDVVLPNAGEPPVVLSVVTANGGAFNVSIPANTLMDTDGSLVTGTVHAEITYWNPQSDRGMGPGNMYTERAAETHFDLPPAASNAMQRFAAQPRVLLSQRLSTIDTFGEAELRIYRGSRELTVLPGATVTETWVLPDGAAPAGAVTPPGHPTGSSQHERFLSWYQYAPSDVGLWAYNESTDLWDLLWAVTDPKVTFDKVSWSFTVQTSNIHDPLNVDIQNGGGSLVCVTSAPKHQGDACSKDADCCPAPGLLTCQDSLCVPNAD